MKNTRTSSIGRIQFHLEEDAHSKLSGYIDAISRSLQGSEGRDEIMADIEARIAELLLERIKNPQQVVTITEVDEIIGIMGSPDAFSTGEKSNTKQEYSSAGTYQSSYKRVFRDPDDKIVFGVCSGIAHHFGVNRLWLRLALVLSILCFGFGLLPYIILAIVIPKARTASEKLEMRGEPADINNIKRTVEEELNDLKKKVENVRDDFKSGRYRNTGRATGKKIGDYLFNSLLPGVGGIIGTILKGIFAFIGFTAVSIFSLMLIALLILLCSGVNVVHMHGEHGQWVNYSIHNVFTLFALTGTARLFLIWGIGLFLGVPLLALIIRIGRAVIGVHGNLHGIKIALFSAWMVGLVLLLFGTFQTLGHFSVTGYSKEEIKFTNTAKTLYVNMLETDYSDITLKVDSLNFYISDDHAFQGNPSLCIQPSPDSSFHLEMEKYARGVSEPEAIVSAKAIDYSFSQHDSILNLSPYYQLEQGAGWRKQKLDLELLVPVGKIISLPKNVEGILCSKVIRGHRHVSGHEWLMSQSGLVAKDSL